ncbi:MAG: diguanylate cyclase [Chloroflexi bacterium]|nr:diguanylate cyclase [Chloroflexota bacterium]
MNILVLETDPREFAIIQQALGGNSNTVTPVPSSAQALQAVQSGGFQVLIVNQDTTDSGPAQLISRVRGLKTPNPVYILLVASANMDGKSLPKGDDFLQRPYITDDLKNRIEIAERIISLTDKLAQVQEQIESQAAFDGLTGFINRAGFLRQAAGELERSRRASMPLSLIALDIDNFKLINDRFGAKTGDDVLEVVAKVIREKSRPYDCIGRWAGDEFVIALPGVIGADAEKISERILAGIRGARIEVPNEPPLNVKVSAGIASILRITSTTEVMPILQEAQKAVARAKEAGGNQVYLAFL